MENAVWESKDLRERDRRTIPGIWLCKISHNHVSRAWLSAMRAPAGDPNDPNGRVNNLERGKIWASRGKMWRNVCMPTSTCADLPVLPLDTSRAPPRAWSPPPPKDIIARFRLITPWNSRWEMREGLAIGFHAVTCLQYAFAVYYDHTYTIVPHNVTSMHNAYGGKFKFLTFWDAVSICRP